MNRFQLVSEPNSYPFNSSIFPDMEERWINEYKYFIDASEMRQSRAHDVREPKGGFD